jgi:DNA-binding CsgD family transcriptional regulator
MNQEELARQQAKTPEQRFMNLLQDEFRQPPRVAEAILTDAQSCLLGQGQLKPGQMRVILAKREAGHGRSMKVTVTEEVIWTIHAGQEDDEVGQQYGARALRRRRIQRLLAEALAQGAAASQEDLARVLNVSVRTIKRDCAALEKEGVYLPTRGHLQGIGRGQSHKVLVVGRWLTGATYDQIARQTHHSVASVRRYVQAFVRVMQLQEEGLATEDIALLLGLGQQLVHEYLAIFHQSDTPLTRQRLSEHLQRLKKGARQRKKGVS